MSSFSMIGAMSTALQAFQRELDVTGNNVSNVDTPGYSRQTATLTQNPAIDEYQGGKLLTIGQGVSVSAVNRVRDMFLQAQLTTANSDLGNVTAQNQGAGQVESVVTDSNGGAIATALDSFWSAWSGLASNPSQAGMKQQVQAAGNNLSSAVRGAYSDLNTLKTQTGASIDQQLSSLQSLSNQVATLNTQIRQETATGATPNALMDQRDQAIQSMASIASVHVNKFGDGSFVVTLGGATLVGQDGAHTVPTTWNAATGSLSDANGTYQVTSGQLAGQFTTYNSINSYQSNLDTLANTLRTQVNNVFAGGVNAAGATGLKFFNDVAAGPQTGAIDLALDTVGVTGPPASVGVGTDPNAIAAGSSTAASNSDVATAVANLSTTAMAALGNTTAGTYYANLVGSIGTAAQQSSTNVKTQTAIVTQVNNQIQSISGVSIDDEMANMLRFQRSYQAAAKALNVADSLMDSLLNMIP